MRHLFVYIASVLAIFVVTGASGQTGAALSDELGAKALFYNNAGVVTSVASGSTTSQPSVKKSAPTVLALRASILLVASDGGTREVTPSHAFKSGDKVKLGFTTNKSGYFYLATLGSSGRVQLLAPRKGEPAKLAAGNRYTFPANATGYFRMDGTAGKEELWAVLADEPLDVINMGGAKWPTSSNCCRQVIPLPRLARLSRLLKSRAISPFNLRAKT